MKYGYWTLFRYNPLLVKEGKNPFQLDSAAPTGDLKEFIYREVRFDSLTRSYREEAERLHALLVTDKAADYKRYKNFVDNGFWLWAYLFIYKAMILIIIIPFEYILLATNSKYTIQLAVEWIQPKWGSVICFIDLYPLIVYFLFQFLPPALICFYPTYLSLIQVAHSKFVWLTLFIFT